MKDHEITQLVNKLTATAKTYAGAQQLREQIAAQIVPPLQEQRQALEMMRLWMAQESQAADELLKLHGMDPQEYRTPNGSLVDLLRVRAELARRLADRAEARSTGAAEVVRLRTWLGLIAEAEDHDAAALQGMARCALQGTQ